MESSETPPPPLRRIRGGPPASGPAPQPQVARMSEEISNLKSYYKGQSVYREGQPGSTAYMVKKGSVNVYRTQNNKKRILMRLGPGEVFGEMGALAGAPRTEGAEAAEFCEVMVLTRQFVKNLLGNCPKMVQMLVKLMLRRLQAAENRTSAVEHKNTFLSVCRLLEMAYTNHIQKPAAEAKVDPNHAKGLPQSQFVRQVKEVLLVSQLEIERILEQLAKLKIIELCCVKLDKAFAEKYITLTNPKTFFQVAANLDKELGDQAGAACEAEHIDLVDLAEELGTTPEILYKKIAQGEFPESLFFFPQASVLEWAQGKDKDFFKRVKRRKKKIEELEDVADVVFVDNATLKQALEGLGYYKIGVLTALAEGEAREKILGNLSKKIAGIVQEEAKNRAAVDESEALDVQDELVSLIKQIKGVAL